MNHLREAQTGSDDGTTLSEEIPPHIEVSDEDIQSALEELPFSSVRQLSRTTYLPKITV
jgi:hypothetical protein